MAPLWLLALAFVSGGAAAFNPCGVGLLPGYVGFLLGPRPPAQPLAALRQALGMGVAMTLGVLLPFSALAASFGAVAGWAGPRLSALGAGVGVLVALWGAAALWRPEPLLPTLALPLPALGANRRPAVALFVYGLAFGLASLGCGFPLFLSVLLQATLARGPLGGAAAVAAYGLGLGATVTAIAAAVRLGHRWLAPRLRVARPWFSRLAGALMCLSGVLVAVYWLRG